MVKIYSTQEVNSLTLYLLATRYCCSIMLIIFILCCMWRLPDSPTNVRGKDGRNARSMAPVLVEFTGDDGTQDLVSILRLDLVWNDYERGYAHGYLLAKQNR